MFVEVLRKLFLNPLWSVNRLFTEECSISEINGVLFAKTMCYINMIQFRMSLGVIGKFRKNVRELETSLLDASSDAKFRPFL